MKNFSPDNNPVCTAQPISMCIVMFCMFDYKVLTRDDFDWIASLVADLDRAVEQSGISLARSLSRDLFLSPLARYTPGGKALSGPKPISLLLIRFFL
jgi:hypothetical protein